MAKRILVVEDDREINNLLCNILEQSGYDIEVAFTGIDGISLAKTKDFNLIILDLMLPYKSGDEVLRELRMISSVPVIIISAKGLTQTKIDLLRLGADDYLTKPFDLEEIVARVESNIRRCELQSCVSVNMEIVTYKDIELNTVSKQAVVNGIEISLTSKEYKILELLLRNQEKVFSKSNLFESVWNEEYFSDDNTLNTHMSNLRNKLKKANNDEKYIETIWGLGYRLYKL
ncbi:response regulator transcription factor [Clostridium frigidicarnis]|uniref:Stage 0 sporulation protein A homolog n=1 Tax=Clostridium frigidicarnis TaxID=84698 RepID=A0A1I1ALZ2_9CLOT|nr:response regulator transcription factor [Clostridium frigidicarnis]SFB39055.1 DNA-binding response regulator, OmpR family, contains REC and winged-helix (wHTH) domain [Clostridium frigidicarnis]